jgi:hypothetical protein
LVVVVMVLISAYLARSGAMKRAAETDARRRGSEAYEDVKALHDRLAAAVASSGEERARRMDEVIPEVVRARSRFGSLASDPAFQAASGEIGGIVAALEAVRSALEAQRAEAGVESEPLRSRLSDLDAGLERFRDRLSSPTP